MVTFRIDDMTCGRCAGTIARAIAGVDKGARVEVDIPAKLINVTSGASDGELIEAIREAGYTAEQVSSAPAAARQSGGGCGCGCGPRKPSPVDLPQAMASATGPCCG